MADGLVEDHALANGEVDLHSLDVNQDLVADGHRVTSTGLWQRRAREPSSTRSGVRSTQTSIGCEHRGAKAQAPAHGRLSDTEPGIGVSFSPRDPSSRGMEARS